MLFFSRWPGTAIANTSKFVGVKHKKKTFGRRQCIPKMRFFPEDAYIGLFGDDEGCDFKICLKYRAQLAVIFRPSGS